MRLVFFSLIALGLALIEHGRLAFYPVAPDLPLGLAAWSMVDGDDEGVVLRPWLVGVCRDLVDPGIGGGCFYSIAYGLLGVCFMPMRSWLFRSRAIAWGGWALLCSLLVHLVDARLGSAHLSLVLMLSEAVLTALSAMAAGWLLGGLPERLRPLTTGGA